MAGPSWQSVCRLVDLPEEAPAHADVDGVDVCLVRSNGQVYAVHDQCTHANVPLSEGEVSNGAIECWLHGSRFDLATGRVLNLPATTPVEVYPISVSADGEVRICLSAPQVSQPSSAADGSVPPRESR